MRSGVETRYIYDAAGNLLAEADANNVITRYYVHGAGLLAAITPADDLYCYHYDGVGNTVAITDGSETIVNSYDYSPFGMIISENETFPQPFKFVGKLGVMAESNGFYYMRARYYDPVIGRFISEDPLGFDGGDVNLYVYGGNNPTLYVDPEGTFIFTGTMILGVAAVKVGGLAIGYLGTRLAQHFTNTAAGGNMPDSAVNTAMAHTVSASAYSAYGGVAAVSGIANAPAMGRGAMNLTRANPGAVQAAGDFISSALPGVPAQNWAGAAGAAAGYIYDKVTTSNRSGGGK